jgi:uncharacterized OB-fold protein
VSPEPSPAPHADGEPLGLLPAPDEDSAPFWEGCEAGELRVQRCAVCGRRRMPPRPMCPWCHSLDVTWETTSGRGRIWSWVVPHPPLLAAYAEQAPYNVVVVELDDDPSIRFCGNVVAEAGGRLDAIDPHTLAIGDAVEVCFGPAVEGIALPRWRRPA